MSEIMEKNTDIKGMIYEIRGEQVMLDSDLAYLYKCANGTKDVNKAVKRNKEKFPADFYFQLTDEEYDYLRFQFEALNNSSIRFQNGTLNSNGDLRGQHTKYLPHVFTEQGVAMLATVVHTKVAADVSVNIMRAFATMRHFVIDRKEIYQSGTSINNAGNKLFSINKLGDQEVIGFLINCIEKLL